MKQNIKEIEKELWIAADKMIGGLSITNYKFVVLEMIFLKYISSTFEKKYKFLVQDGYGLEEDRDAYMEDSIFFVPENARWDYIVKHSKDYNIGEILDNALDLIEKENPSLKGVLFKIYNSPDFRSVNLGEIIDLFTNLDLESHDDSLGQIYEYFLEKFASKDGKRGGEFYTPSSIVKTMVEMLEPKGGRIYDPACGSGGMLIQCVKYIEEHNGNVRNASFFGQEKNPTTWKLAKMNLAIRSIEGNLGEFAADTFHEDLHKGLMADFILANPPFNMGDWGQDLLLNDCRWKYEIPPKKNANYAWLQHVISKLSGVGRAAIVLPNSALTSSGREAFIRSKLVIDDLVDCIVAMPSNLFYSVTIPCSIWILNKKKKRKGHTLFIDATGLGSMITRKLRDFSSENIMKIANTYHDYQNTKNYEDVLGFCRDATLLDIEEKDFLLNPSQYVGMKKSQVDASFSEEKMAKLIEKLVAQMEEAQQLDVELKKVLRDIGYGND